MGELEKLLAEGKITASEYGRLVREQAETQSAEYRKSEVLEGAAGISKFYRQNLGISPSDIPTGQAEFQMSMSPEELETYTSRGITPSTYRDYEDDRAEAQSISDKWGNGMVKLLGKSATAVAGGVGMIGSVLYNVAGQLEDGVMGLSGREGDTSFHQIYDNDYYRALDNINKGMDEILPHYITREEEEASLLESLGTHNFWSNDFLQGVSFVVGAIATEGLMSYTAGATGIRNLTKVLNGVNKTTKAETLGAGAGSLFSKSAALQTGYEAATIARQMITGAGYESAVEAMSFADDAKREWVENYRNTHIDENGNPLDPSAEELAAAMKEIYAVGNSVFGMNLIVTGLTQAKTLPGVFAPKLGRMLGTSANPEKKLFDEMVDISTLSTKQLTRAAKRAGKSVDELKASGKYISKEAAYSGLKKAAVRTGRGLEGALFEGGQEGLQKAISYGATDYLNDRFDSAEAEDIIESGMDGLTKAFGNNAESWKEIFIGAVLGSAGGPGGKGTKWQGGVIEAFRDKSKSPEFQKILDLANKYATNSEGILNNYLKHFTLITNTQNKKDKAVDKGDIYDYKSEEATELFDYLNFMSKMDRLSEVEEKHLDEMNKLTKAEFSEKYGYKNLSTSDFNKRKAELNANIKRQVEDASEARNTASSIYRGGDADVLDGIAYTIFKHKNVDHREGTLAKEISELTGIIDPRSLIEISRDNQRLKLKDGWINTYKNKVNGLKAARTALEKRLLSGSVNKKDTQIADLEKAIKEKERELKALLRTEFNNRKALKDSPIEVDYELNFEEFEEKINKQVAFNDSLQKHYATDGFNKEEIDQKLTDLKRLARDREQYIGDFNRLLTEDGIADLESEIDNLRKAYAEEQIAESTYAVMEFERLKNPATQIYKAQELAFKLRAKRLSGVEQPITEDLTAEPIDSLSDNANQYYTQMIAIANNVAGASQNNEDKITALENIIKQFTEEAANVPEELKRDYQILLDRFKTQVNGLIASLKSPTGKSGQVFSSINKLFNLFKPKEDRNSNKGKLEQLITNGTILTSIRSEMYFELIPYPEGGALVEPHDEDGSVIKSDVRFRKGIKIGDQYYGIKVAYKLHPSKYVTYVDEAGQKQVLTEVTLGYINDPKRTMVKKPDGSYGELNINDPNEVKQLNSSFVNPVTNDFTESGKEFVEEYVKLQAGFEKLLKAFGDKNLEPNSRIPFVDLKSEGGVDPKTNKTIWDWFFYVSKSLSFDKTKSNNLFEELDSNYDSLVFNFEDNDGNLRSAPLLVNPAGDSVYNFYYYDKDSKKLVAIDNLSTIDYLTTKFIKNGDFKFSEFKMRQLNIMLPIRSIVNDNNDIEVVNAIPLLVSFDNFPLTETNATDVIIDSLNKYLSSYQADKTTKGSEFSLNILSSNAGNKHIRIGIYNFQKSGQIKIMLKIGDVEKTLVIGTKNKVKFDQPTKDFLGYFLNFTYDNDGKINGLSYNKNRTSQKTVDSYKGESVQIKSDKDLLDYLNLVISGSGFAVKNNENEVVKITNFNQITRDKILNITVDNVGASSVYELNSSINIKGFTKPKPKAASGITTEGAFEGTVEFDSGEVGPGTETFEGGSVQPPAPPAESSSSTESGNDVDPNIFGDTSYVPDEDSPFKNTDELIDYEEEFNERQSKINDLLPSWIPIREFKEIARKIKNKGFTYGGFIDGVVYIASKAPKGVEFHEAFHVVFRTMLSDAEIMKCLNEAKQRYPKPTSEQIDRLRNINTAYQKLPVSELVNIYYEEQMADEFMDYMNRDKEGPKGFIEKIFAKIKRFINWVFSGFNRNYIDRLFKKIEKGGFKNSKKLNNIFSTKKQDVFKLLSVNYTVTNDKGVSEKRVFYLPSVISNNILNRLFKTVFDLQTELGYQLTRYEIKKALEDLTKNYYTAENFKAIIDNVDEIKKQDVVTKLQQINAILKEDANIKYLVQNVATMLDSYKILNFDVDAEQDENEMPTEFGIKSVDEVGGYDSMSKEMKKYLFTIPVAIDELDLDIDVTDERFSGYADAFQLYNSLMRMMSNVQKKNMLSKLLSVSADNQNTKQFTNKFLLDIANELGLKQDGKSLKEFYKDIANLSLTTLNKSLTFNMFASNFRNASINQVQILFDANKKIFRIFRSNINDVQDLQVDQWNRNYVAKGYTDDPQKFKTALGALLGSFRNIQTVDKDGSYLAFTPENFQTYFAKIKEALALTGLETSDLYIKVSLIKAYNNITDTLATLAATSPDIAEEYTNYLSLAEKDPSLEYLNAEVIANLQLSSNPFIKKDSDDRKDRDDDTGNKTAVDESSISRLKRIAYANSMFDENVIPTTFTNSTDKRIFSYIKPNYITDFILTIQQSDEKPGWLSEQDDAKAFELFKLFLTENDLQSEEYLMKKYFDAIKYNPIFNNFGWDVIKNNLSVYIADGLRSVDLNEDYSENAYKESEAKAYSALDVKGKVITMMSYFLNHEYNNISVKTNDRGEAITFYPVIGFQNENKSTQYPFLMPRINAVNNGQLTQEALYSYYLLFTQEYTRIQKTLEEISDGVNLVKDYHSSNPELVKAIKDKDAAKIVEILSNTSEKQIRGLRLQNFVKFNADSNLMTELYEKALNNEPIIQDDTFDSRVSTMVNQQIEEYLEYLSSKEVGVIQKTDEGIYVDRYLPQTPLEKFTFEANKNVNIDKIKEFFVNDFINSASLINMFVGDIALQFKDPIDLPKRMAGLNAAGSSQGNDVSRIAILKEPKLGNFKRADAQSHATLDWYINKYLKSNKKWNSKIEAIYDKLRLCQKISAAERDYLDKYGALANSRKLSSFTYAIYLKTSTEVLTRSFTSYIDKADFNKAKGLVKKLNKLEYNTIEYKKVLLDLQKLYKPIAQAEYLHDLFNKMEIGDSIEDAESIGLAAYESAIKTVIYDPQDPASETIKSMVLTDKYIREQVITDNMKNNIIDGTQKLQLIDSEHVDPELEMSVFGKKAKVKNVIFNYQRMLAFRINETYTELKKSYLDGDKVRFKALLEAFNQSLNQQNANPTLIEMFKASDTNADMSKFNLNMPKILGMYEKMLFSYLSKPLSHKVDGHKFSLLSDIAYSPIRDDKGRVITMDEFRQDPEKYKNYPKGRLEVKQDEENSNVYYAECVIPRQFAEMFKLKTGDYIDSKFAKMLGVRIPTQEKSSMAYLKVVDVLPAEKGNTIILPAEVVENSGADFDIDSEFVQIFGSYVKAGVNNGKPIIVGSYVTEENEENRLKLAYEDFLNYIKDNKAVKADYKYQFFNENSALNKTYSELASKLSILDYSISKLKNDNFIISTTEDSILSDEVLTNIESNLLFLSEDEFSEKDLEFLKPAVKEQLKELFNSKELILKQIEVLKEQAFTAALIRNKYPTSFEEFLQYKKNNKTYKDIVNDNYNAVKNGDLNSYNPITFRETNNFLLELQLGLVHNIENNEIWNTPNERDSIDELTSKWKTLGKVFKTNITDYNTITSKIKMSVANQVGASNIGIAALANTMGQHLIQAGVDVIASESQKYKISKYSNSANRKNKNNQLMVTTAVDNAKNQDEANLNLTQQSKDVVAADIILDNDNPTYDFESTLLLLQVPEIEDLIYALEGASSNIKNSSDGLAPYHLLAEASKMVAIRKAEGKWMDYRTIPKDQLLKLIAKCWSNDLDAETDAFQNGALGYFLSLKNVSRYLFNFTQLTSIIKGTKPSTAQNIQLLEYLKNIGIEVYKENGEYKLKNTMAYDYEVNDDPASHPIDLLKVIENKPLLKTQIITFYKLVVEDSSNFLLHNSKDGNKLIDMVKPSLKYNFFNNEERVNRLVKSIVSFMSTRSLNLDKRVNNIYREPLIFTADPSQPTVMKQLFTLVNKAAKTNKKLAKNRFLKAVAIDEIEYTNTRSPLYGLTQQHLISNSMTKLSAKASRDIMDDFFELYHSNFGEDTPVVKDFVKAVVTQVYMKDGGLYKNKTLLNLIEPFFQEKLSQNLDVIMSFVNKDNNEKDYMDMFGISKEEFFDQFKELFARDINNSFYIRGNNIKYIVGNIKRSIAASAERAKDSYSLESMEELEAIVKDMESENPQIRYYSPEFHKVSPIRINKEKTSMVIQVLPGRDLTSVGFDSYDDETEAANKKQWYAVYKRALFASGIVGKEFVIGTDKKPTVFTVLPEFYKIVVPSGNSSETLFFQRKNDTIKKDKRYKGTNPDVGIYAEYEAVSQIASKEFSPYYFNPEEHDALVANARRLVESRKKMEEAAKTKKPAEIVTQPVTPVPGQQAPVTSNVITGVGSFIKGYMAKEGNPEVDSVEKFYNFAVSEKEDLNTMFVNMLYKTGMLAPENASAAKAIQNEFNKYLESKGLEKLQVC